MAETLRAKFWKHRLALGSAAFDLAVVWILLSIRYGALVRGDPGLDVTADLPSWWWNWGGIQDWLLIGPDAGNWASNAEAWAAGESLDPHRLPTYTMLTAWFSGIFGDVVVGGHMVNHLLSALLGVMAYALGRATSGRAVGVAAGLLTAWSPELVNNQVFFGVDPALQWSVLLLAIGTFFAMKRGTWPWVLLMGLCLGLALGTHYLLLLFLPISLSLLFLMDQSWSTRIRYVLAAFLIGYLVFKGLTRHYDDFSLRMVASVFSEGVAGSDGRVVSSGQMGTEAASGFVFQNLPSAPRLAVQRGLRCMKVEGIPWGLLVIFFWMGIVGWGLGKGKGSSRWDWRTSLFLLAFLSPLILLEASRAPDRYALFSRPFFFLCVARGALSLIYLLEEGLSRKTAKLKGQRRKWVRSLGGALMVLLVINSFRGPFWNRWELYPPTDEGLGDRTVAAMIKENFPRKGGMVTTSQALEYFTERTRCPGHFCPRGGDAAVAQCFGLYLRDCTGSGPIPFVLTEARKIGLGDQRVRAVDENIQSNFTAIGEHKGDDVKLTLYSLDRKTLRKLSERLRSP